MPRADADLPPGDTAFGFDRNAIPVALQTCMGLAGYEYVVDTVAQDRPLNSETLADVPANPAWNELYGYGVSTLAIPDAALPILARSLNVVGGPGDGIDFDAVEGDANRRYYASLSETNQVSYDEQMQTCATSAVAELDASTDGFFSRLAQEFSDELGLATQSVQEHEVFVGVIASVGACMDAAGFGPDGRLAVRRQAHVDAFSELLADFRLPEGFGDLSDAELELHYESIGAGQEFWASVAEFQARERGDALSLLECGGGATAENNALADASEIVEAEFAAANAAAIEALR